MEHIRFATRSHRFVRALVSYNDVEKKTENKKKKRKKEKKKEAHILNSHPNQTKACSIPDASNGLTIRTSTGIVQSSYHRASPVVFCIGLRVPVIKAAATVVVLSCGDHVHCFWVVSFGNPGGVVVTIAHPTFKVSRVHCWGGRKRKIKEGEEIFYV